MTTTARTCVICGTLGTEKWTLTVGPELTVADLCPIHAKPMHEAVEAVKKLQALGDKPPVRAALDTRTVAPGKSPRSQSFAPLAWTPPAD